jgi:hypothetical protein
VVPGCICWPALSHTTGEDRTDGIVLTQRQVEAKTSEIAWFAPMLDQMHRVRDVTYTEDHSRVRTGNAPRVMATLRTLAINALRSNGWDNIAKGLRHMARNPTRPLTLLGIPT